MKEEKESELQKMLSGKPHQIDDPELFALRAKCRTLLNRYNSTLDEKENDERKQILAELFGFDKVRDDVHIQAPFYCDYGRHIRIGKNFMANYDCVILDCAEVYIGDNVLLAPKVQIYPVFHPTDPIARATPTDISKPIRIGNNVWIGGGSIILPGVTIGDNTIIGAGSVVSRNIESDVIAVGNPCRVIRKLDPSEYGKRIFL